MIDIGRAAWVVASGAVPIAAGVAISEEHVGVLALVASTVAVVVGVVTWIDKRIRAQITTHSAEDRQRHRAVLKELAHLRELLHVKFGLPPPPAVADEDEGGGAC